MFAYSVDELIEKYGFEVPNYIKIDVDNIEAKILYGADKTLDDNRVKSVFVELDEKESSTNEIIKFLAKKGFALAEKTHGEMFDESAFKTQFNYIFVR